MAIHKLKILPVYYNAVESGIKTFEIRDNSDRGFNTGDEVQLKEWLPDLSSYSGKEILVEILYVTNFEQMNNYVVFGFKVLSSSYSV